MTHDDAGKTSATPITALSYIVSGRVQGVGFRYFVYRHATRLELKGWVKNLWNGDVEVHAEGPVEALAELEQYLNRGPSFAYVTNCRRAEVPVSGFNRFKIER